MNNKYEDIINMPHHISKKHPQMGIEVRAAQFAPFAALTGYEDAVEETGRFTTNKIELTEEEKIRINDKIKEIKNKISKHPKITITYFVPDEQKHGGKYITDTGIVKKIDEDKKEIVLEHGNKINIGLIRKFKI